MFQLNKVWFQKYHVLIFQFLPKNDARLFLYLSILVCEWNYLLLDVTANCMYQNLREISPKPEAFLIQTCIGNNLK